MSSTEPEKEKKTLDWALTKVRVPKGSKNRTDLRQILGETIEWVEMVSGQKKSSSAPGFIAPNGYKVDVAVIYIPSRGLVVFGASACSPDDIYDAYTGKWRALGRARQSAFANLGGLIRTTRRYHTLCGGFGRECYIYVDDAPSSSELRNRAFEVARVAAENAERRAIAKEIREIERNHPTIGIAYGTYRKAEQKLR